MGADISSTEIHVIDDTPEYKEELLKEFRQNDKDNDARLEKIQFFGLISKSIPQFRNFVDVLFAIFSNDGKFITREKFIEFCDSMQKMGEDQTDPKSLIMRIFSYVDKNHNGYLGPNEIHSLGKLIYDSKPNAPKFKKSDAEKVIRSQKPGNPLKGLSKVEFVRLFLQNHPISIIQTSKPIVPQNKDKEIFLNEQQARRNQTVNDVILRNKIVVPYISPKPREIDEKTIQKLKEDFLYADTKKRGALSQKGIVILLQNQCLIPSSFAFLVTELFGEDHYVNFDGYRDLNSSLIAKKNDKLSFSRRIFNRYDTEKKNYLTINQCIRFGRDICLNEISNSRESWNARLNECRTIYHRKNIDYEYFQQIMFSLQ